MIHPEPDFVVHALLSVAAYFCVSPSHFSRVPAVLAVSLLYLCCGVPHQSAQARFRCVNSPGSIVPLAIPSHPIPSPFGHPALLPFQNDNGTRVVQSGARAELEMGQEEKLDEESRLKGEPKPKPKHSRKRQIKRQAMAGSHTHGVNNRRVRTMNRCQLRLTAPAAAPAHPKKISPSILHLAKLFACSWRLKILSVWIN